MRICFFCANVTQIGGIERISLDLINALFDVGYDVSVITYYSGEKKGFYLNEKIKVDTLFKKKSSIKKSFFVGFKFRKLIKKNNPDVLIYVDTIFPIFFNRFLFGINIKKIAWEHFCWTTTFGKKFRIFSRQYCLKKMDKIVVLTNRDRDFWLKNKKIKAEIFVINNFICSYTKKFDNHKFKDILERENSVLAVGRLAIAKGYDMLLDIWKIIEDKTFWTLKIAGGGGEEDSLKEKAKILKLKNVKFLGATKDVNELYENSKIHVLTSRYEGFPLTLIEGEFFGLPQVAFNCNCGPAEIISKNGYLVDCFDIEMFSDRLLELINNPKKLREFSEQSYINSKKYLLENIIKEWEKIL